MSRNGSGVFSKINTFVAGNPITASSHNANWDDIALEITNSVAADGQTSMTGPLKATSGTVGAPGLTFASDPDSGLYRIGSNNVGLAVNGAKVLDVATTGMGVTGVLTATTSIDAPTIKQGGFSALPVGEVKIYAGTSAPSGYLFCYGQAVSRTTYAALFAITSTTYGVGDGSTTFNLPDLRGRVIAGKDDMGGSSANRLTNTSGGLNGDTLGASGGTETHTLITAELAAHTHVNTLNDPGHQHSIRGSSGAGGGIVVINSGGGGYILDDHTGTGTTGVTITNASAGSGSAHNNVQPTFILNYIIFAGV